MSDRDLTNGPVTRAILKISAPMSLGIFGVLSVGIADAYFLGRVGQTELAAVGYIYPVTTSVTSLSIGLSAGANAALSQAIGRGDTEDQVRRLGLHALGLGILLGIAVAALLWAIQGPLFGAIGASGQVATEVASYIGWWCVSFPFLVAMMIVNSMFRARGDGLTSAVIMLAVAVVNVALDPLLIFGYGPIPALGTEGAAIATGIARSATVIAAVFYAWKQGYFGSCGPVLRDALASVRQVIEVGLPAAFSNAINPMGMAIVTAAVATLGETAVAGFGAATRVQSLAIVPLLALSAGIGPVVGQNWGAGKHDRAQRAVRATFLICVIYGAALAAALLAFADPIAGLIASGQDDAAYTAEYLRIVGLTLFGYGILVTGNAAMNARSKALWSMSLSLGRIALLYVPLAWLGVWLAGFTGIVAAAALANVVAAFAVLIACQATGLLGVSAAPVAAPANALAGSLPKKAALKP